MPPRNSPPAQRPTAPRGTARPWPVLIQTLQGWSSAPTPLRYSSGSKTGRIWPGQVCPSAAGTAHATHKPHTTHPEALAKSPQTSVAGAAGAAAGCGQDRRESASSRGGQRGRKKGEKEKAVVADSCFQIPSPFPQRRQPASPAELFSTRPQSSWHRLSPAGPHPSRTQLEAAPSPSQRRRERSSALRTDGQRPGRRGWDSCAGVQAHCLFSFQTTRGLCKASASPNSQSKERL